MGNIKEDLKSAMGTMNYIGEKAPEVMAAFKEMAGAIEKEGALPSKTKELIALALSVKSQCSYCIALHVKKSLDMGLTSEEIIEACNVAVLMGGGPSLMYMSLVKEALEEFS